MADSKIEWVQSPDGTKGKTWNPVRGCSRVSKGCENCYAERQAHRFSGGGHPYQGLVKGTLRGARWTGDVRFVSEMLDAPLRWRKPRMVFVNSMSDLFHPKVTDEQVDAVFGVMWACLYLGRGDATYPGHVFQVLTKRPHRMREYLSTDRRERWAYAAASRTDDSGNPDAIWDQVRFHEGPHPRIWLGTSIEDQATADERIPHLLAAPAAVRFVSAEPLLGPITLDKYNTESGTHWLSGLDEHYPEEGVGACLDWLIVGGESGPKARPCNVGWIRSLVRQCQGAGVACFVKQLGAVPFQHPLPVKWELKHRKGADMTEWPEDLRVRQFPEVPSG